MEPDSLLFLCQTSLLIIVSVLFPQETILLFWWCSLFGLVSVYFVLSEWYKADSERQRICFLLWVCVCVHVCVHTGKKMEVYYPATGIKSIYPQVLDSLFPKLSGENKCLHLITWTGISISLQFGQKSTVIYMLFGQNFKIILLTAFAFQLGTEERVEKSLTRKHLKYFQTACQCIISMATCSVFVAIRNFTIIRTHYS